MSHPDFNLLVTLDVLLAERSVARAARRLGLSSSAMSRALARLRSVMGDPLLVRAGRGLVATPRAEEIRARTGDLVLDVRSILRPAKLNDLKRLVRTFYLRTSEGFVENFGPALLDLTQRQAPGVRLHFMMKPNKESTPLREGMIDMETGVVGKSTSPELQMQRLFQDRFVGVVREGHPTLSGRVTLGRYCGARHVCISRRLENRSAWEVEGVVEQGLEQKGGRRDVAVTVGGFATALSLVRRSDLVATVPERHTGVLRHGMHTFELPFSTGTFEVCLLWHPRLNGDAAHRWLRGCIREVCSGAGGAER